MLRQEIKDNIVGDIKDMREMLENMLLKIKKARLIYGDIYINFKTGEILNKKGELIDDLCTINKGK